MLSVTHLKKTNLPIFLSCFLDVWSNQDQPSQLQSENCNLHMVGICDNFVSVLDSLSFSLSLLSLSCCWALPQQPFLSWCRRCEGSRLLLLCSRCLSGSPRDTFSGKFSLPRWFCHELSFFFLFYCYFFFTSGFFNDLVQCLPYVALYKALSGSKVSILSWSPGTLGSPLFEISATFQEVLALYSFAYCLDVWSSCEVLSSGFWHCLEIAHGNSILFFFNPTAL